jgi:hypothetical protein
MLIHTGIISFCDRVRYNIKSSETKDIILNDMERKYQIRILQRHWFKLDNTTSPQLQKNPHWACLRSNGNPYYMFFTKFDDVNIIYFIDKKVQPGYEKPRIILGKGMFHDDLFNDTILDGEMVRRNDTPGWIFLVNDVIAYCGDFLKDLALPKRIAYAYDIFGKQHIPDPFFDVCTFSVKKYVDPSRASVENLIALAKTLPYTNRGMYLWCHNTRLKPKLYNFDDGLIKSVQRKVKDCPDFRDRDNNHDSVSVDIPLPSLPSLPSLPDIDTTSVSPNKNKNIISTSTLSLPVKSGTTDNLTNERTLWLRKTEIPDIFDIFTTQQCNEKLGTAYIQSLSMSKKLRTIFKDLTVAAGVPFVCSYNQQFDKWMPIRQVATSTA